MQIKGSAAKKMMKICCGFIVNASPICAKIQFRSTPPWPASLCSQSISQGRCASRSIWASSNPIRGGEMVAAARQAKCSHVTGWDLQPYEERKWKRRGGAMPLIGEQEECICVIWVNYLTPDHVAICIFSMDKKVTGIKEFSKTLRL